MEKYITVKDLIERLSEIDENSIVVISHEDDSGNYFVPLEEKNINVGKFEIIKTPTYQYSYVHYSKLTEGLKERLYGEGDVENFENKNGIRCVTFS